MNCRLKQWFCLGTASLVSCMAACSSSSQVNALQPLGPGLPPPDSLNQAIHTLQEGMSTAQLAKDSTAAGELDPETPECIPWQTYRENAPEPALLPKMPPGFQSGCIFGTNLGDRESIYILRDGISLARVFDQEILTTAPRQNGVLNIESRIVNQASGFAQELIAGGNAMVFNLQWREVRRTG